MIHFSENLDYPFTSLYSKVKSKSIDSDPEVAEIGCKTDKKLQKRMRSFWRLSVVLEIEHRFRD